MGDNNYIQSAKKSALEDLVSQIKVNVSSTSLLTQIDNNKEFQEKYEQIIQTTAADEIQEFEQAGAWEDDLNYWVYYKLSKQRYKEIKDQQKRNAITLGLDFFTKAKEAERNNEPVVSLGFYYQGFRAVEKNTWMNLSGWNIRVRRFYSPTKLLQACNCCSTKFHYQSIQKK
jgi:hypothetical protein